MVVCSFQKPCCFLEMPSTSSIHFSSLDFYIFSGGQVTFTLIYQHQWLNLPFPTNDVCTRWEVDADRHEPPPREPLLVFRPNQVPSCSGSNSLFLIFLPRYKGGCCPRSLLLIAEPGKRVSRARGTQIVS